MKGIDTMTTFTYDVEEVIAVLSERGSWALELNKVSWNGRPASYDLRKWADDHSKMSKGISLQKEDLVRLRDVLNAMEL